MSTYAKQTVDGKPQTMEEEMIRYVQLLDNYLESVNTEGRFLIESLKNLKKLMDLGVEIDETRDELENLSETGGGQTIKDASDAAVKMIEKALENLPFVLDEKDRKNKWTYKSTNPKLERRDQPFDVHIPTILFDANPLDIHIRNHKFKVRFETQVKDIVKDLNKAGIPCEDPVFPGPKGEVRYIFKTIEKGDPRKITDVRRVSLKFTDMECLKNAVLYVLEKRSANVCRFKNRLEGDTITGYRDILLNYAILDEAGIPAYIVEIQFQHERCLEMKNAKMHKHYGQTRLWTDLVEWISADNQERIANFRVRRQDKVLSNALGNAQREAGHFMTLFLNEININLEQAKTNKMPVKGKNERVLDQVNKATELGEIIKELQVVTKRAAEAATEAARA